MNPWGGFKSIIVDCFIHEWLTNWTSCLIHERITDQAKKKTHTHIQMAWKTWLGIKYGSIKMTCLLELKSDLPIYLYLFIVERSILDELR